MLRTISVGATLARVSQRLPDFDDIEAESRALDFAESFEHFSAARSFLASWPALDRAAKLVLSRADKLDGDHYEMLTPVADALAGKHPLAATMALRAMIEFSLDNGRSSRYKHAARHFQECASLASAMRISGNMKRTSPSWRGRAASTARKLRSGAS